MKQLAFIFLFAISATFSAATLASTANTAPSQANVLVKTPGADNNLLLQFSQPVRWQQVLAELQARELHAQWAQLTKPDELAALEANRAQILQDLHTLGQQWARKGKLHLLAASIEIANQVKDLPLVARQSVTMSYDLVRLNGKLNPLLNGDYELQLAPRSTLVWAQGLVRLAGKRPFVGGGFAHDYGRLSLLSGGEQQRLWVIQPDGKIISSPVNPFAPEFIGVAPGATLYVGFAKLPHQFADLNQRIMTLFAHREI